MTGREKTDRGERLLVIAAIAVLIGGSAYDLAFPSQGTVRSTSSSPSSSSSTEYVTQTSASNLTAVVEALDSHISHIEQGNAAAEAVDYAPNATMIWSGDTIAGGTFKGLQGIQEDWQFFLAGVKTTCTVNGVNATALANGTAILTANLNCEQYIRSPSGVFEPVNGNLTVSGTYSYLFESGEWQIARESSSFFNPESPLHHQTSAQALVANLSLRHTLLLPSIHNSLKNLTAFVSQYEDNATIVWEGKAGGLNGTYSTAGLTSALEQLVRGGGSTQSAGFFQIGTSPPYATGANATITVGSSFSFEGNNSNWGYFNGTVSAQDEYVYSSASGSWLIAQEVWNFTSLNS